VSQSTLPMGYQFSSRSPLTLPSVRPAAFAQAEFARATPAALLTVAFRSLLRKSRDCPVYGGRT
jgi:hypothetical protein